MKKLIVTTVLLAAGFSASIAATDTLIQRVQAAAPQAPSATVSPAEEPISLSGPLIAAGVLVVAFLATRRRVD